MAPSQKAETGCIAPLALPELKTSKFDTPPTRFASFRAGQKAIWTDFVGRLFENPHEIIILYREQKAIRPDKGPAKASLGLALGSILGSKLGSPALHSGLPWAPQDPLGPPLEAPCGWHLLGPVGAPLRHPMVGTFWALYGLGHTF